MSNPSSTLKRTEEALQDVIQTLIDGQEGFQQIGDELKNETHKRYFLAESLKRAQFRGDLETVHCPAAHEIANLGVVEWRLVGHGEAGHAQMAIVEPLSGPVAGDTRHRLDIGCVAQDADAQIAGIARASIDIPVGVRRREIGDGRNAALEIFGLDQRKGGVAFPRLDWASGHIRIAREAGKRSLHHVRACIDQSRNHRLAARIEPEVERLRRFVVAIEQFGDGTVLCDQQAREMLKLTFRIIGVAIDILDQTIGQDRNRPK